MAITPEQKIEITKQHPLEKRSGEAGWRESPKAHQALLDYWTMGSGRSLPKLTRRYQELPEYTQPDHPDYREPPTSHLRTLKRWSSDHGWQKRIGYAQLLWYQEMEEVWRERQLEVRDADYKQAQKLRDSIAEVLAELPNFIQEEHRVIKRDGQELEIISVRLNESFFLKALDLASDLQRKATGLDKTTLALEGTADDGHIVIELTDSNISPEDI